MPICFFFNSYDSQYVDNPKTRRGTQNVCGGGALYVLQDQGLQGQAWANNPTVLGHSRAITVAGLLILSIDLCVV